MRRTQDTAPECFRGAGNEKKRVSQSERPQQNVNAFSDAQKKGISGTSQNDKINGFLCQKTHSSMFRPIGRRHDHITNAYIE